MNKKISNAKDFLGQEVEITIDRQLGTKHPKWDFIYTVNYGFVPGTLSPDGEELDAYLFGVEKGVTKGNGRVVAIIHRTNDDDDKLIVSATGSDIGDEEIRQKTDFQEKFFESTIIREKTTITHQINTKALELLSQHPEGLRTSELLRLIKESDPSLHPKTINGLVWKLTENFPNKVYKPERGLFRLK